MLDVTHDSDILFAEAETGCLEFSTLGDESVFYWIMDGGLLCSTYLLRAATTSCSCCLILM